MPFLKTLSSKIFANDEIIFYARIMPKSLMHLGKDHAIEKTSQLGV